MSPHPYVDRPAFEDALSRCLPPAKPAAAQTLSPLQEAMGSLGRSLEALEREVQDLQRRLDPVLVPAAEAGCVTSPKTDPSPACAPLVDDLICTEARVHRLFSAVSSLNRDLCV